MQAVEPTYNGTEALKEPSARSFGLVFTAFFALIGMIPVLNGRWPSVWLEAIAAVFLSVTLLCPGVLAPFNRLWFRFGLLLHRIANPIVMGAVFFLVVTPTALIMRGLGKDLLRLRRDRVARSYWIERRPPGPDPKSLKNQF